MAGRLRGAWWGCARGHGVRGVRGGGQDLSHGDVHDVSCLTSISDKVFDEAAPARLLTPLPSPARRGPILWAWEAYRKDIGGHRRAREKNKGQKLVRRAAAGSARWRWWGELASLLRGQRPQRTRLSMSGKGRQPFGSPWRHTARPAPRPALPRRQDSLGWGSSVWVSGCCFHAWIPGGTVPGSRRPPQRFALRVCLTAAASAARPPLRVRGR